jgi:hypothetical protein
MRVPAFGATGVAGLVLLAACSLLPTEIRCGTLSQDRCDALAGPALAAAHRDRPGVRVVRLTFSDAHGSYTLDWDDGGSTVLIVD